MFCPPRIGLVAGGREQATECNGPVADPGDWVFLLFLQVGAAAGTRGRDGRPGRVQGCSCENAVRSRNRRVAGYGTFCRDAIAWCFH
jgi:hypothetical protein